MTVVKKTSHLELGFNVGNVTILIYVVFAMVKHWRLKATKIPTSITSSQSWTFQYSISSGPQKRNSFYSRVLRNMVSGTGSIYHHTSQRTKPSRSVQNTTTNTICVVSKWTLYNNIYLFIVFILKE